MTGDASVVVTRNDDENRWEARVDGELAGFAAFHETPDLIVFTHTEVDPAHRGGGHASILVQHALDDVREGSLRVVPLCSYVKAWIERHPDYQELTTR